ncbi:thioredoxin-like protein Clot [Oryza brachyantha]|uniref:Thioredoxin-like protein Clot n=1 Tax=Oryza brachyantha TaxID=4533 RepID=J3MDN6_ORYBR|nr:thioredoxin-like protein Clot [Oryza brachyantha]
MAVEKVDTTVADFDAHFDKLFAAGEDGGGKVKLLLFLADRDASSDLTWCPDCNVAEPVIYERVEALGKDVVLLRAYVGDKPTWRDPAHPWRVDPRFRLTGVPTLIRWENGAAAARLGDDEAHLADKIDAVLNDASSAN